MRTRFATFALLACFGALLSVHAQAQPEGNGGGVGKGGADCVQWRKLRNSPPTVIKEVTAYPDVWDFAPDAIRGERIQQMVLLPDGDVGLFLVGDGGKTGQYRRMFFNKPLSEEDRCRIANNVGMSRTSATLSNGHYIMNLGFGGTRPNGCYAGLEDSVAIYADDSRETKVIQKTLLYILDRPRRWNPKPHCYEGLAFDYRIVSLSLSRFLSLPDGTFVLAQLHGERAGVSPFIVRLDQQFKTKSRLINQRFFIMDSAQVFAGQYGSREGGDLNLARLHQDLYTRLMEMKGKGEQQ
jgi:hypothetical protein